MTPHATFTKAIAEAATAKAAFTALDHFVSALVPVKLLTISMTDMKAGLARRAYSSNELAYPVSGTKKINPDAWFRRIHEERQLYVENDVVTNDREHFFDYELIASLGCAAAMNLPVVLGGSLVGTVNILAAKDSYTPEMATVFAEQAAVPAMLAYLIALNDKTLV